MFIDIYQSKFEVLQDKVQKILQYYECPNCTSCCNEANLLFEENEFYDTIKIVDKETAQCLQENSKEIDVNVFQFSLENSCPMLKDKCTIYKNRPAACRRYPFEFYPDPEKIIEIHLIMCPLSINILYDYARYFGRIDARNAREYMKFYNSVSNIKKADREIRMVIWENRLDGFIRYLKKVKK